MYSLPKQIVSANRANVETFTTFANAAFSGVERVVALNLNTVRSLIEEGSSTSRSLLAVKNMQDVVAMQATVTKPDFDKFGAYARRVYDIASQTQVKISQMAEVRVSDINQRLDQELDKMAKNAPPEADLAMAALRSAVSAANSAYLDMSKAAKQFAEIAEANLEALTAITNVRKAA
ncbi:MAG: phasin family protein [Sulfuritalea sp.]|nr:phasin family protein [Sulfuritalea sp.]